MRILSKDVFESWTHVKRNEKRGPFPFQDALTLLNLYCYSVFTLIEAIFPNILAIPLLKAFFKRRATVVLS